MRAHSVVSDSLRTQRVVDSYNPPGFSLLEISRQEYWSGLPFPAPGDLPNPGIEPASLASPALAGRLFTTEPSGKPHINVNKPQKQNAG